MAPAALEPDWEVQVEVGHIAHSLAADPFKCSYPEIIETGLRTTADLGLTSPSEFSFPPFLVGPLWWLAHRNSLILLGCSTSCSCRTRRSQSALVGFTTCTRWSSFHSIKTQFKHPDSQPEPKFNPYLFNSFADQDGAFSLKGPAGHRLRCLQQLLLLSCRSQW